MKLDDIGPCLSILPPAIARLFGGCGRCSLLVFAVPNPRPPSQAGELLYRAALLAGRHLLARWAVLGSRSVCVEGGRVRAEQIAAHAVEGWAVPIDSDAAVHVLVATVFASQRYRGWEKLLERAKREMGGAS
jgi:hypothetical protein